MSVESFKEKGTDNAATVDSFSLGGLWDRYGPLPVCGKDGKGNGLTPSGRRGRNPRQDEKSIDEL